MRILFLASLATIVAIAVGLAFVAGPERGLVVAAFLGAFFSFLLLALKDDIRLLHARRSKAHNALVELELCSMETMAVAAKNSFALRNALGIVESPIEERGTGKLVFKVTAIPSRDIPRIPLSVLLDLLDTDIMNRAFSLSMDVGTINSDLQMLEHQYSETVLPAVRELEERSPCDAAPKFGLANAQMLQGMKDVYLGLIGLQDLCVLLTAHARLARRASDQGRFRRWLLGVTSLKDRSERSITSEVNRIKEEIREVRRKATALEIGKSTDLSFWEE